MTHRRGIHEQEAALLGQCQQYILQPRYVQNMCVVTYR